MPSKRGATQQVNWRVDATALELLERLKIAPHQRGQYVSRLIMRAAQEAGLIEAPPTPDKMDLVILKNQLQSLQRRIDTALEGPQPAEG